MPLKTLPFDSSEYLDDGEAQAELLADAIASADAEYIKHALGVVARARGMTSIAEEAGISRKALYRALIHDEPEDKAALLEFVKALAAKAPAVSDEKSPPAAAE